MVEEGFIEAGDLGLNTVRVTGYRHVNLALEQGKAHALCAQNRGGKTELLLTLAGRMRPTEGTLNIAGNDCTRLRGMRAVRKRSGLAFFEHVNDVELALPVRTVVSAELGLAGRKSGRKAAEIYLECWGLLGVADSRISELDRFEYDLLGIALGMIGDPEILAVQDIENSLTELQSSRLAKVLVRIAHEQGTTVVCGVVDYDLATHFDSVCCLTVEAQVQRADLVAMRNVA